MGWNSFCVWCITAAILVLNAGMGLAQSAPSTGKEVKKCKAMCWHLFRVAFDEAADENIAADPDSRSMTAAAKTRMKDNKWNEVKSQFESEIGECVSGCQSELPAKVVSCILGVHTGAAIEACEKQGSKTAPPKPAPKAPPKPAAKALTPTDPATPELCNQACSHVIKMAMVAEFDKLIAEDPDMADMSKAQRETFRDDLMSEGKADMDKAVNECVAECPANLTVKQTQCLMNAKTMSDIIACEQ